MNYHFRHKAQGTRHKHWQTYVLNLSNNLIRRVFTRNLFISSKLSPKSPKTALLVLALLLLSSSWNVQANSKKVRAGNRSDAIIMLSPVIDYARPNLYFGRHDFWDGAEYEYFDIGGPPDIWDPERGFLVNPADRSSYDLNFPTTGAHNLYFDLLITGIEPEELTWAPVTHEGITATVTNVVANEKYIPEQDKGKVVARVKLTGPYARNQWYNPHPSPIAKPKLPQTFELVGRDRKGNEVIKYGFVLKQWFVHRKNKDAPYSDQLAWCNSLGYRMPRVNELTNAKCGVDRWFRCRNGVDGATPRSPSNHYQRHIGAGFLTEWGAIGYGYLDEDFTTLRYWADGEFNNYVNSVDGDVNTYASGALIFCVICTTP